VRRGEVYVFRVPKGVGYGMGQVLLQVAWQAEAQHAGWRSIR
jgi:hypothetical protein